MYFNSLSNHVIGFLILTHAKIGFWAGIVLHPNPIPNFNMSWDENAKTQLNPTQLAV